MRQLHAIEMQLSYDTVGEDNWDYFHPTVTCSAKGKRLRDVLDEILGPYHLTYILADGVLLIVKDSDPLAKSKR